MNIRNAKYNAQRIIDCEYQHPVYGWIPFTASPLDSEQLGRDIYALAIAGVVAPSDPVVLPIPQAVTMRQARLALLGAGLMAGVTTAINALPSPQKEAAQIEWEYSQTVERQRGFVLLLGDALGLDSAELDQLFVTAAGL